MPMKKSSRPGPRSMFRDKIRKPVSLTLTAAHHAKVLRNTDRLGLTRADLIALLIDKYADGVTKESRDAYADLRRAVDALGGSLEHIKQGEPRGGTWVLTLGARCLVMASEQSMRYPALDACYRLKDGIVPTGTWDDYTDEINPAGVAALFQQLASS